MIGRHPARCFVTFDVFASKVLNLVQLFEKRRRVTQEIILLRDVSSLVDLEFERLCRCLVVHQQLLVDIVSVTVLYLYKSLALIMLLAS